MEPFSILRNLNALYVEDDARVRSQMAGMLEGFFAELYVAAHGAEGLKLFREKNIHVIISDQQMPIMTGLEMASEVRKIGSKVPIFITSSFSQSEDLIESIRLNLVDYLIKPFNFARLKEALAACAKRIEENGELFVRLDETLAYCALKKELIAQGETVALARKEYELLELLIRYRGRLVGKDQIEAVIYGNEIMSEAALKNLVLKLRKKIGKERIVNVHGAGFILR